MLVAVPVGRFSCRSLPLKPSLIACSCFISVACQDGGGPLSYTLPAGTLDSQPVSPFSRPYWELWPHRSIMDPAKGRPVQVYADQMIGGHVANFVAFHQVIGRDTKLLYFFPAPGAGPGPGLCRSKVYTANGRSDGKVKGPGIWGRWEQDVYAVAGSVAPLPNPWPPGYAARLRTACAARRDMGFWYGAPPGKAYVAARLADAIIASAKRPGRLPFKLSCWPYPHDMIERPRCAIDVRKTVASIDPRAILSAGGCLEARAPNCLIVQMAKSRARGSTDEDQMWTVEVEYREDELGITRVAVGDTRIKY